MVIAYQELKKSTTVEFVLYHASFTIATKAVVFIVEDIVLCLYIWRFMSLC